MTNVSGERPISGDAHVGRAEFAPALSKIKGAFASIFPGKTVDDLTIATKLSSDALDKTLNFTPPGRFG